MMPAQWSVARACLYGALAGPPVLLARTMLEGRDMPSDGAYFSGLLSGGAIGGALLFGIVAVIRNFAAR